MADKDTDFKPVWWLRSPHLQTLWPAIFRKRRSLDLRYEQLELEDGDFVDLCWSKKKSGKAVLLLHGLEGNIRSHYINGIFYRLEQAGYSPVLMYFRGCSGRINRLPRAYHSGETGDLAAVVEHINLVKKAQRRNNDNQQGGFVEIEKPIHISNIMLIDKKTNKPTRFGAKILKDGKKVRVSRRSGEVI